MLKINHIANSFISVASINSTISCDPWVGVTRDNAWYSYPVKNIKLVDKKTLNSDFIYISHLHCDHFDLKTLKKFKKKNLTFIIKKFKHPVLKNRIEKLTKKKVIELEPFKKKKINKDFTVAIIPQLMSNSSDLPDNIQYDLDTSIVIQSNHDKTIFYNNVDMPINLKILKRINKYILSDFKKKIDVFCCGLGAASEFPHCFLNLNRDNEKNRIINESLKELKMYLSFLKPKYFFPAGGKYLIYGKFNKLNKYIAQPNFNQIKNSIIKSKTKIFNIIGGGSITIEKSKKIVVSEKIKENNTFKNNFIKNISKIDYYYENSKKINLKELDIKYTKSKENYLRALNKKNIKTKWKIKFNIYKKIEINKNCKIDHNQSKFLKKYELKNFHASKINKKNIFHLDCFLEYKLFDSLISSKFPWNTSLSGSTILYKRTPNKFNIDMVFSLNFLKAS